MSVLFELMASEVRRGGAQAPGRSNGVLSCQGLYVADGCWYGY